jgi:hypothetical protein
VTGKVLQWVVDDLVGTAGIKQWKMCWKNCLVEIQSEYDTEEFIEKQIAETNTSSAEDWNWIT